MTPRERVLKTLNFRPTDRVPRDLWENLTRTTAAGVPVAASVFRRVALDYGGEGSRDRLDRMGRPES